jgi:hypothetical protein
MLSLLRGVGLMSRSNPALFVFVAAPLAGKTILNVPPKFIRPCIPTTAKAIPRGDDWLHEPKLDGYRFQIATDDRVVRLHSKSGSDWTKRLVLLADALAASPRCSTASWSSHQRRPSRLPRLAGSHR